MKRTSLLKPATAQGLTLNAEPPAPALQHITANITPSIRHETLEGKPYLVVPMVMMVEGVHNGSNGPLYYPPEELGKTPVVWNCKPVVVYHPTINGQGVSACSPDILETYRVGMVMNASFDKLGRLKAEAWLDEERCKKIDPRVLTALEEKKVMELSTGLFTDNVEGPGEWNGEKYVAVARNHRPDHLALLPDKTGACSVAKGAGLLRNEAAPAERVQNHTTLNEVSFDAIREQIGSALCVKVTGVASKDLPSGASCPWVCDVYPSFFVYYHGSKLFMMSYSVKKDVVTLEGDPTEVVRVTQYTTVDGTPVGNQTTNNQQTKEMNKKQIVDDLIANHGWSEAARPFLMSLNEDALGNAKGAAPVQPKPAVFNTAAEFVASAPASFKGELEAGLAAHNAEKAALVATITGNAANIFKPEELASKSLNELKAIAALASVKPATPAAPAPAANAAAAAPARFDGQAPAAAPVANTGAGRLPIPLPLFDEKK
jgi:hypothetical protein